MSDFSGLPCLLEILNEKEIASRVIDLRIHDGTFVPRNGQPIAYRRVDDCQIVNDTIGEAHKADREPGALHSMFEVDSVLSDSEALEPYGVGH